MTGLNMLYKFNGFDATDEDRDGPGHPFTGLVCEVIRMLSDSERGAYGFECEVAVNASMEVIANRINARWEGVPVAPITVDELEHMMFSYTPDDLYEKANGRWLVMATFQELDELED